MFSAIRFVYSGLFYLALPFLGQLQDKRVRQGKEEPERLGERRGISSIPRPEGDVAWFHAASVGEVLSVLPLIEALRARSPELSVVITTVTVTSARILSERAPKGVYHQYCPLDHRPWVRRFLDHWNPTCVLWVESEFWPNAICMIKERRIPLILINGRVSPTSFARWRRYRSLIAGMLSRFDLCLAQSKTDARYLTELGARNVATIGNLKLAGPPLAADQSHLDDLTAAVDGRPRWLLSSSHPGEETIAISLHCKLSARYPNLLTVIAPRHPDRGNDIAKAAQDAGLVCQQRSKGELPNDTTGLYVADTVGEMGIFYRACNIVVMGKSLLPPGGGQNPYEPAKVGCTVVFGPYMGNFVDLTHDMLENHAAVQVGDHGALFETLENLLGSPDQVEEQISVTLRYAARSDTIIDDTLAAVSLHLGK